MRCAQTEPLTPPLSPRPRGEGDRFHTRHAFPARRGQPPSPSPRGGEGARRADEGGRKAGLRRPSPHPSPRLCRGEGDRVTLPLSSSFPEVASIAVDEKRRPPTAVRAMQGPPLKLFRVSRGPQASGSSFRCVTPQRASLRDPPARRSNPRSGGAGPVRRESDRPTVPGAGGPVVSRVGSRSARHSPTLTDLSCPRGWAAAGRPGRRSSP